MIYALILFAVTYLLMMIFQKQRPIIALASAVIFVASGMMPFTKLTEYIDLNVLMMIAGTMGTVALLIESKMPALLADIILEKVPNVKWAIIMLSLFAGIVSAFIDNVATVLMIAPIALAIAKKLDISPVGMIIAIAVSSNLQGAATLVGDTTSIMLAGQAKMNFVDFFAYKGKPGIFFAVELGALAAASLLLIIFRREKAPVTVSERTKVTDFVPSVLMLATVLLLIGVSMLPRKPELINGIICVSIMAVGAVYSMIRKRTPKAALDVLKEIDYQTLLLLFGLFIVVGGITEMGVIDEIAKLISKIGGGNVFVIYTVIVWASVVFSAFIDNIPYVATMLPVTAKLAADIGIDPTVLYFGLLIGATLGGNLTPIGASANIAGIGILRREGYTVKNSDFLKIGVPFTLAAVIPGYLYIWFVFGV